MCSTSAQAKDYACQEACDDSDHHGEATIEKAMIPNHGSNESNQVILFQCNASGSEQGA
jgi:hypothetical protein